MAFTEFFNTERILCLPIRVHQRRFHLSILLQLASQTVFPPPRLSEALEAFDELCPHVSGYAALVVEVTGCSSMPGNLKRQSDRHS